MRIFSRACASDDHVFHGDPRRTPKMRAFQSEAEMKRHLRKARNEYEYVQREYGYDNMPPSQYVPSRSVDSSIGVEERVSDISGSESDDEYVSDGHHETTKGTFSGNARTADARKNPSKTRKYADLRGLGDEYLVIDRVPTAFGYHSDDSAEDLIEEKSKVSRYSIDPRGRNAASDTSDDDDAFGRYFSTSESFEERWRHEKAQSTKQVATSYVKDMLADDWESHHRKTSTSSIPQKKASRHANTKNGKLSDSGYSSASMRKHIPSREGSTRGETRRGQNGSNKSKSKMNRGHRNGNRNAWEGGKNEMNSIPPTENIQFLSNAPRRHDRNRKDNIEGDDFVVSGKASRRDLFGRRTKSRRGHAIRKGNWDNSDLRNDSIRGSLTMSHGEDSRGKTGVSREALSMFHGEPPSMTDGSYDQFNYRHGISSHHRHHESQSMPYTNDNDDGGSFLPPHHRAPAPPISRNRSSRTAPIHSQPFDSFQDPAPLLRNNSYRGRRVPRNYTARGHHPEGARSMGGTPQNYNSDHSPRFADLRRRVRSHYIPPPRASQAAGDVVAGVAGCYPGYNF